MPILLETAAQLIYFQILLRIFLQLSEENINRNFEIQIANTIGEVIFKTHNQNKLDVSRLSSRLYFAKLIGEKQRFWAVKMIKQYFSNLLNKQL